ncbi:MAG: NifU-like domain [Bacillales bacterium]|nr:NifU-like domain [Bacillales bacterium]
MIDFFTDYVYNIKENLTCFNVFKAILQGVNLMEMQEQVQEVLDKLRPFLQRDGGDVELVDLRRELSAHY